MKSRSPVLRPCTRLLLRPRPRGHRAAHPIAGAAARRTGRRGAAHRPLAGLRRAQPARHPGPRLSTTNHQTPGPSTPSRDLGDGLRKSYGDKVVLDGIDLTVAAGHGLRPARPERRRQDHHRADPVHPDPGRRRRRSRVAGHDVAREPDAVRAAIGVTGQFSAVDDLLTGEENLLLMADLHHLGRARGPARAPPSCWSGSTSSTRPRKPAADLLRRHAAPARPRHDPGRRPAGHLPRRADHRPRPAQPPHHVADRPRPRRRRRHRSSSPPSTWRRPTSSPTGSRVLDDGRLVAEGTAERAQAAGPRRPRPAALRRRRAARRGRAALLGATVARRRGARPAGPQRRQRRARCEPCSTGSTTRRSRSTS